jgi:hypothetical protein
VHSHASHSGIGPDDHHAQVHTHNHDTDLTGVSPDDHHAQVHSIIGADHSGFPGGTTTFLRADATFAAPGGGAGLTLTTVEVTIGTIPRKAGRFTIAGAGLTVGKPVLIQQASGPYTGKGSRADEAEADLVMVTGKVISATLIECFWNAVSVIKGNVKFDYAVSG